MSSERVSGAPDFSDAARDFLMSLPMSHTIGRGRILLEYHGSIYRNELHCFSAHFESAMRRAYDKGTEDARRLPAVLAAVEAVPFRPSHGESTPDGPMTTWEGDRGGASITNPEEKAPQ